MIVVSLGGPTDDNQYIRRSLGRPIDDCCKFRRSY